MPLDSTKKVAEAAEETEALSEQADLAPEAPVSQTRAVTKEVLEVQPYPKAPVPPAFIGSSPKPTKPTKWDELSQGIRSFDTGSFRGDA